MEPDQRDPLETAPTNKNENLKEPLKLTLSVGLVEESVEHEAPTPQPSPVTHDTTLLEYYILEIEKEILHPARRRPNIFKHTAGHAGPRLKNGLENRILVMRGCFNPPHRGHLELLCHAFLRTDDSTIAAIIVPVSGNNKANTHVNGLDIDLNRSQKSRLWQDDIIERFAWIWPGTTEETNKYFWEISTLAKEEGYNLSFIYVGGADHAFLNEQPYNLITSDITRPTEMLAYGEDGRVEIGKPPDQYEWDAWQTTQHAPRSILVKNSRHCPDQPCWICWKLKMIFPEYFEGDFEEDPTHLAGFAHDIILRCHEDHAVIWSAKNTKRYWRVFMFSGRQTPNNPNRPEISSTKIRRLLGTSGKEDVYNNIKDLALNPTHLLQELGLNEGNDVKTP